MSEQLFEPEPAVTLTERQAHALVLIRNLQPVKSDVLGAELHAYRKAHGGKGHAADAFCDFCTSEGRQMGDALERKGLVRYKRGAGWMTVDAGAPARNEPSVQIGRDDPWPEGF